MTDEIVELRLRFRVVDPDLLLRLTRQQIGENGGGHEFDPDDLADCIAELLLHSNPDIKGYLDYGIELVGQDGYPVTTAKEELAYSESYAKYLMEQQGDA